MIMIVVEDDSKMRACMMVDCRVP